MSSPTDPLIGRRLDERYEILEFLAQGAYGAVYRARQHPLERDVAVKVVHGFAPAQHAERLDREGRLLAALDHPRVVQVYDGGRLPDGRAYLVEAFIEGTTLSKLIEWEGSMAPARAAGIVAQLLDGLEAVHALGVIHRDVKPSNIMIVERDGHDDLKLLDFGIARSAEAGSARETLTATGVIIGTPSYMAPEQIEGAAIGPATDVYAAGNVLFELLTGQPPFERANVRDTLLAHLSRDRPTLPGSMPPALRAVVDRALALAPADRFPSAIAMADALRAASAADLGLDGRYEVLDLLGSGSFGTVLLGRHRRLDRRVAIKVGTVADEDARARFEREANVLASLRHPGLVSVWDSGVLADGRLYMVQDWIDGRPLGDVMAAGPLPVDRAVRIAIGVLDALQAAHDAGVVHRDVKPGNIMVEADDTVRLIDFGLARSATADEEALTTLGLFVGTVAYAAPEQSILSAVGDVGPAVDQYALGVVLYEMLAGRRPFEAETLPLLVRLHHEAPPPPLPVPPALWAALSRALAKAPGDRFPSAHAMADALRQMASPPTAIGDPPRARRRALIAAAAAAALLAIGAALFAARPAEPEEADHADEAFVVRVGAVAPEVRIADLEAALAQCLCDRGYDVLTRLEAEAPEAAADWRPRWAARCAGSARTCPGEGGP